MKLLSQCTEPPTMNAAGRDDCRNISVIITAGMGPARQLQVRNPKGNPLTLNS